VSCHTMGMIQWLSSRCVCLVLKEKMRATITGRSGSNFQRVPLAPPAREVRSIENGQLQVSKRSTSGHAVTDCEEAPGASRKMKKMDTARCDRVQL
jgi:hypothetical protein